jgi:hypothetical protein
VVLEQVDAPHVGGQHLEAARSRAAQPADGPAGDRGTSNDKGEITR